MRKLLSVTIFSLSVLSAGVLSAQTPNLTGVWKADLSKSKLAGGPPPQSYVVLIEQNADKLTEITGVTTPRGEQRSTTTFNLEAGKASTNQYRGAFMRSTASWQNGALVVDSKIAQAKPQTMTAKYTPSEDGKTLTVETSANMNGRDMTQTLVLDKQPDAAGAELRKPEKTAGEVEKNVQLLKNLPASQFIDTMRSFNLALGVECNFCHVQGDFSKDDKHEKVMARKMITMTHNINANTFDGKAEIRCYTCHKGSEHPASHPAYEAKAN